MSNWKKDIQSLFQADETAMEQALDEARKIGWKNFGKRIRFNSEL
jgi:hypothetical protein